MAPYSIQADIFRKMDKAAGLEEGKEEEKKEGTDKNS